MSKLINFFFSFDKLMKESLVRAFFWLALLLLALTFTSEVLGAIQLDWFAAVFEFVNFFVKFLLAIVGLRLGAELAIALFRINDNLSPDGGKSETANIDPVMEARHAAESAAKRAQEATKSAVDRTSAATKSATERSKFKAHELKEDLSSKVRPQVSPVKKASAAVKTTSASADKVKTVDVKPTSVKKAAPKKAAPKKTATKTSTAKKTSTRKTSTKAKTTKAKTKTSNVKRKAGLKLDGTPRKKPGPKPKS